MVDDVKDDMKSPGLSCEDAVSDEMDKKN